MSVEIPLPDVDDPLTAPYWAGTREGRLLVPRCEHCHEKLWPPEPVCPVCLHTVFDWEEVEPRGTVWSFAVYHRALDPAFTDDIPYAVLLVELEDGSKMYGIYRGGWEELEVGMTVTAVFEAASERVTLVRWRAQAS